MSDTVRDPELISVPVEGGELAALHWAADAPGAPIAVLVHGITATPVMRRLDAHKQERSCAT